MFRLEQKAVVESEPKPLLKPRQLVEPRPQVTDEPAQPDDVDETGQQTAPAALPAPAQEIQSLFQPIEQPQPDRPPSPPPKPEVIYSDQVSCRRTHCKIYSQSNEQSLVKKQPLTMHSVAS